MKWYMALNEAGTSGDIGLHTRLAVLSARRHTDLDPHLLYSGRRNLFTEWLEGKGVKIIDSRLPYLELIEDLAAQKRYSTITVGHWLRTNVCLEERQDEFILYTDVDTLFLKQPKLSGLAPRFFAAAPEFDKEGWNYFNAGIMLLNVPAMREGYALFEMFLKNNIAEKTYHFHDQIAYNQFYRGRWNRLPLELNWKPYWGANDDAQILHFHGPKFAAIKSILDEDWDWQGSHGKQIGSLFMRNVENYRAAFTELGSYLHELPPAERAQLETLFERVSRYDRARHQADIDLRFMNFKMFPTDLPVY